MASIAVRLWVPRNVDTVEVINVVNDALRSIEMAPPFTDSLQSMIDTMFDPTDDVVAMCFRLSFPRGPVISTERIESAMRRISDDVYNSAWSSFPNVGPTPDVFVRGTIQGLGNLEVTHLASRRIPYTRTDTLIRDITGPPTISAMGITRSYTIRRRPTQPRPVRLPSHACTRAIMCAVCLTDTEVGEVVCTLPCAHTFHKKCISPWVASNPTCPTCRGPCVSS